MNLKEIDSRIEELKTQLDHNQSRHTEVYSRIVGYYRSVKNWNKGKKEEYAIRKTYEVHYQPTKLETPQTISEPVVVSEPVVAAKPVEEQKPEVMEVIDNSQGDLFAMDDSESGDSSAMELASSYRFYFRQECPNCPPMKAFVQTMEVSGEYVDVDTEEGLQMAVEDNVYTAPTVILFDSENKETFRTDNVVGLEEFLTHKLEVVTP
ncbi:MAG: glutaredoxin domain-containing protein [Spirochaetaceae bacterium]|jgi:nitrous oxide reductase|nr:glutaredoxin domain-containing protein [Spirochaetaceae bacterium]